MIYVISDLHGCLDEYLAMLEKIKFSDEDTLYIIGDIVDRGPHPIGILEHVLAHKNIILMRGNHELMMTQRLCLLDEKGQFRPDLDEDEFKKANNWVYRNKGITTVTEWFALPEDKRREYFEFLDNLPGYLELSMGGKDYILVHGGFRDFDISKRLDEYDTYGLVWERIKLDSHYYPGKITISGHTPTANYGEAYLGKMILMEDKILIDCGCVYGSSLGCLCLDTMEEFYIERL